MSRTLVLCKPDAVERGLCGEIISRLEHKGLRIAAAEMRHIDTEQAKRHYEEHLGKAFIERLVNFITRSPLLALVVEGPEDTWEIVRLITGATNPAVASPGTIRGDLASASPENLIHASDSAESAEREIALWFPALGVTPATMEGGEY
jgi:nucleoside-diphosphate kinase